MSAVIFSSAILALNIASWSNWQMDPPKAVMSFFREAGVVLHDFFHFGWRCIFFHDFLCASIEIDLLLLKCNTDATCKYLIILHLVACSYY
jgi:hypothetical protein